MTVQYSIELDEAFELFDSESTGSVTVAGAMIDFVNFTVKVKSAMLEDASGRHYSDFVHVHFSYPNGTGTMERDITRGDISFGY